MRHMAAASEDELLAAAMATVVRAPPKDFRVVKREWAAIRIQTAFRGLLVYIILVTFLVNGDRKL